VKEPAWAIIEAGWAIIDWAWPISEGGWAILEGGGPISEEAWAIIEGEGANVEGADDGCAGGASNSSTASGDRGCEGNETDFLGFGGAFTSNDGADELWMMAGRGGGGKAGGALLAWGVGSGGVVSSSKHATCK